MILPLHLPFSSIPPFSNEHHYPFGRVKSLRIIFMYPFASLPLYQTLCHVSLCPANFAIQNLTSLYFPLQSNSNSSHFNLKTRLWKPPTEFPFSHSCSTHSNSLFTLHSNKYFQVLSLSILLLPCLKTFSGFLVTCIPFVI